MSNYYNSPQWKVISKQIRIRDNNKCQGWKFGLRNKYGNLCNRRVWGADAHVHHIDGNKYNNDFSNLILLCPVCHSKIHHRYLNVRNKKFNYRNIEEY